jgi:hypothetical protein
MLHPQTIDMVVGVLKILVMLALTNVEAHIFETRYSKKRLNYNGATSN